MSCATATLSAFCFAAAVSPGYSFLGARGYIPPEDPPRSLVKRGAASEAASLGALQKRYYAAVAAEKQRRELEVFRGWRKWKASAAAAVDALPAQMLAASDGRKNVLVVHAGTEAGVGGAWTAHAATLYGREALLMRKIDVLAQLLPSHYRYDSSLCFPESPPLLSIDATHSVHGPFPSPPKQGCAGFAWSFYDSHDALLVAWRVEGGADPSDPPSAAHVHPEVAFP